MKNLITLNSNTYHGYGLEDAVAGARAAGIKYIELAAVRGYTEHVMPEMSDTELDRVRDLLKQNDLTPIGMCGHSNIMTEDGRANLIKNFDLAAKLGIGVVATGTGETHGDEHVIEDDSELVSILKNLSAEAATRGITLCVETHGASYATGAQIKELAHKVGAPNFGINYDTANVIFYGNVMPYDDLRESADTVSWIHLKDSAGEWNEWNFPAVGDGDTDFVQVLQILRETGCTVPLSIEVEFTEKGPSSVDEVHDAVARSVRHLESLQAS